MLPSRLTLSLVLGCFAFAGCAAAPAGYQPSAGSWPVETRLEEWRDAGRDRTVPVKIYFPAGDIDPAACPVILFSHGLGGTRETYAYLGEHWAAHGYISVHVQHVGSDDSAWKNRPRPLQSMRAAAMDPANIVNRPLDVRFVLDELTRRNADPAWPLHGRLDPERIGMAGHSFGAFTTMAVAGQKFFPGAGREITMDEPRIKAAIAMSSPVTMNAANFDAAYGAIRIPVLHMTGTKDASPIGDTSAEQRRIPFDHTTHAPAWLVVFEDGDHMIFSGRLAGRAQRNDAMFQELICDASTAYWDMTLRANDAAASWFNGEMGFAARLGDRGTFEKRNVE